MDAVESGACSGRSKAALPGNARIGWSRPEPTGGSGVGGRGGIDMCTIYAAAVRRMLPDALLAVDAVHVVQLATTMVADVRRSRSICGHGGHRHTTVWNATARLCPIVSREKRG